MTMTAPPNTPGSQRLVPRWPRDRTVRRLREFVHGTRWVLRSAWGRYLAGSDDVRVSVDHLTRDQQNAALAWLEQQRHPLYRVLEGGQRAPEGWLESLPLHRALRAGRESGDGAG